MIVRARFACRSALLLVLAPLLTGCQSVGEERTFDLVKSFPVAEVRSERRLVDFGTPGSRVHLGAGWSRNKTTKSGLTYAWGQGRASSLDFFLTEARDLEATLRCFPAKLPGANRQRVEVVLNEQEVTALVLDPSPTRYTVRFPARALRAGSNRLVFRYAGRPSNRHRPAVGWDFLELAGAHEAGEPQARTDEEPRLYVPFGSEVSFYMESSGEGHLDAEDITVRGGSGGRLEMQWQVDGEPLRGMPVDRAAVDEGAARLGLPGHEGQPLRLTLRAVGRRQGGADWQGIVLRRPVVRWRARPPGQVAEKPGAWSASARPNVLLYLVDTLRADRLGCYGQTLPLSPHVDRLAAEGVVFERAIAQTSWTKPAVASILTGLGPLDHGVNRPTDGLPEAVETLSELLARAGYRGAAFVTNPHITVDSGFAQGFDHFEFSDAPARELNEKALDWLAATDDSTRPFFLYVHTLDVHRPYEPIEPFRQRFAPGVTDEVVEGTHRLNLHGDGDEEVTETLVGDVLRLYNAEVAQNDAAFGDLWEELRRRRLDDDTIIVFVSDHGEAFYEHGMFGHWWDLYQQILAVPFVLRIPGGPRGVRVGHSVQHVDLVPTVLDALGLEIPSRARGRSLLPLVLGAGDGRPPAIYSYMVRQERRGLSVVWKDWKLIEPLGGRFAKRRALYQPWRDPSEQLDLSEQRPVLSGYLAALARAELLRLGQGLAAPEVDLATEDREALKALGYIQ